MELGGWETQASISDLIHGRRKGDLIWEVWLRFDLNYGQCQKPYWTAACTGARMYACLGHYIPIRCLGHLTSQFHTEHAIQNHSQMESHTQQSSKFQIVILMRPVHFTLQSHCPLHKSLRSVLPPKLPDNLQRQLYIPMLLSPSSNNPYISRTRYA